MQGSATLLIVICVSGVSVAGNLSSVEIAAGSARFDGEVVDYHIDMTVRGEGFSSVSVTTPPGPPCTFPLQRVAPGVWLDEQRGFVSLQDIVWDVCFPAGDYTVHLVDDQGAQDSVTVFYDPGTSDPFAGYPEITSPDPPIDVPLEPVFTWFCQGTCGPLGWDVLVLGPGESRLQTVLPLSQTNWQPGGVEPQAAFAFTCQSREAVAGGIGVLATTGGDSFVYEPLFTAQNIIHFSTRERVTLRVERDRAEWDPIASGLSSYDVVQGDLFSLRATGGEFTVATSACLADDTSSTSVPLTIPLDPGEGHWVLVRDVGGTGPRSYDALTSSQPESRDPGIDAAPAGCP